jgi:hypothetical protein
MFIGTIPNFIYIINIITKMFNCQEDLKFWMSDYISKKGKKSLHIAINNSKSIKEDLILFTSYLPENTKFNQRCYHILNDLSEIPLCKECGENTVNFNNRNKEWKYLDFCSPRCGTLNKETIDKYKKTNLEKYGVDNISKSEYFKKLMLKTNKEKWGVDWYQQSDDFKSKSILTCLKKYGFENYTKTEEFKSKIRETFMLKYGVDWYSKSEEFKQKIKTTSLEKYGKEHPMLDSEYKEKVSQTIKERYGQDWYVLTNQFKEHCFNLKEIKYGNPTTSFKLKDYKLPSNKTIKVQGYENFALDILLKNYKEEDLCISYSDIKEEIGMINYLMDEKDRIYLPDIYIKSENKIIEVKSEYTYNLEIYKNKLKKDCCISLGIKFEFWIMDKNGKIIEIK